MDKQIKSDSVLKIFSVVIAICLWFYVVQVQDPEMVRTIKGVPVVFTQSDVLENRNLVLLNDNQYTVDIKIQGTRQYVTDVDKKNLTILADVGNIKETGTHSVLTSVVLPYANLTVVNKNPSLLSVTVDDLISAEKPVEVLTEGAPKDPYIVGNLTATPKTIKVKGPKSIVDGIRSVAGVLNVSGKTADTAAAEPPKALDSNKKEIDSRLLHFSADEIMVHAEILKTKTVDVEPVFASSLAGRAKNLQLDESSISEIKIAGTPALVDALSAIETKPITADKLSESGEATVTLNLPPGIQSVGGTSFTLRFVPKNND